MHTECKDLNISLLTNVDKILKDILALGWEFDGIRQEGNFIFVRFRKEIA